MKHILIISLMFAFSGIALAGDWIADDTGFGNSSGPVKLDTQRVEESLWNYVEKSRRIKIAANSSYTFIFKSIAEGILRIHASCYDGKGTKKVSKKDCSFVVKYKYREDKFFGLHHYVSE